MAQKDHIKKGFEEPAHNVSSYSLERKFKIGDLLSWERWRAVQAEKEGFK